ncbi:MAG TPA: short-chain dehydrogenase [Marinilabiliales bacterium]|nr:MAG: short-chain dehydrogenase [Bacteroidetes bacterium GWA2_40_14]OFX57181.1 MAG: short-chain dehydrogenase [Bacteroidetes bacterium GWC2_40_13]OFX72283.1 MAG: short-chain dehydrogenase [Bacteroidetes bacterium GWD2_40_43]OFX90469.1 MAG: short-chain dehydrogenase [Bacteroidetes bacterium GWE2_40_63]OFY17285.1 MAG: short-chain dehydrogenase [Bacteroidetes bacterium GWF2_40_13]OFZ29134.1 MAG: short-chain dehydrogenase [Bacteroidetes bacterium RIFOXYC2_FULL_40_12]HAN00851.1 short-chain dehyd
MSSFNNKTLLITGGASGIGFLMAQQAIAKGAGKLIIWDINEQGLHKAIAQLKTSLPESYGYVVDVSSADQIKETAQKVKNELGRVHILINNAGVVVGRYFHEHTHADINFTIGINTNALMHVALEFLPEMMENNEGHLVNIASAAGMVANPQMSVYCASKWAIIGWSDSVRLEMKKLKKKVKVTTVTPYYISTGMFDGVKSIIPITKPETAAEKIIAGIEKDKAFIRMPWLVYTLPLVKGVLPLGWFDFIVGKGLGVYKTMDHFKGRR